MLAEIEGNPPECDRPRSDNKQREKQLFLERRGFFYGRRIRATPNTNDSQKKVADTRPHQQAGHQAREDEKEVDGVHRLDEQPTLTVTPNVQFSGRATTRHARRERTMATPRSRRARDAGSRSAATAG